MLPQIYRKLGDYILLTDKHKEGTVHGGRPAYHHATRSMISNLCQQGDLIRVNRGCYSLTIKGRERVAQIEDFEKEISSLEDLL